MTTVSNLTTVQSIYEAFGKGDIPTILANLSDAIVWQHQGNPAVVPFAGTFRGKDEVLQFFQKLGQNMQFASFHPHNFREEDNQVINDVTMEATALPTNNKASTTVKFSWTFDENGKVSHWKNEGDLDILEAAFS